MWLVCYAAGSVEYTTELYKQSDTEDEAFLRQE